jgi:hypothetical protein
MELIPWILLGAAAIGLVVFGLGVVATLQHTSRPPFRPPDAELPPISLLKPIKGRELGIEEFFSSF